MFPCFLAEKRGLPRSHQLAERGELIVWLELGDSWVVESCDCSERKFFALTNEELNKILFGAIRLNQFVSSRETRKKLLEDVLGKRKYQTLEACLPEASDLLEKALAVYAPTVHKALKSNSLGYKPNGEVKAEMLASLNTQPENFAAVILAAQMYAHTELYSHQPDEMYEIPFVFDLDGLPKDLPAAQIAAEELKHASPETAAHMYRMYLAAGGDASGFVEKITPEEAEQNEKLAVLLAQKTCEGIQIFLLELQSSNTEVDQALYEYLSEKFLLMGCAIESSAEDFAKLVIAERYGFETKFDFMDDNPDYLMRNLAGKIAHYVLNTLLCAPSAVSEKLNYADRKSLQIKLASVSNEVQSVMRKLSEFFMSGRLPREEISQKQ